MSNALPSSMSNASIPAAPVSHTRLAAPPRLPSFPLAPLTPRPRRPVKPRMVPHTRAERMVAARERIRAMAESALRFRTFEIALDLDLSEFYFARQFRVAFGMSPHAYYDQIRAERARAFLREGLAESEVARLVGFRRPGELRSLLTKTLQVTDA